MTNTSLRQFSRDSDLRKKMAASGENILIKSREKDGKTIMFMIMPLPEGYNETVEQNNNDLDQYIGLWKEEGKTNTIAEDKKELRKLWTKES